MSIEPLLARRRPRKAGPVTFISTTVLCGLLLSHAAQPKISYIDLPKHLPQYVLIHFDTEPNRTYVLEYTESFPTNPSATWSNLWGPPPSPQQEHYIYPDTRYAKQRFYRLRATP